MTSALSQEALHADGLHSARLPSADYAQRFADAHPTFSRAQAVVEAERCLYCYDAPCVQACPTRIDIPTFIARIAQDNVRGAAQAILEANPLGGMCARVCPTENLCEGVCVRHDKDHKPVEIGRLQRYATDSYMQNPNGPAFFTRAARTGKTVAVVGAGPAGLACAHGLARAGHDVLLFDAHAKLGGLNEYGLATYKTANDFAQKEIADLLSIGGITVKTGQALGKDFTLESLLGSCDAVFLGLGLAGVNALGLSMNEPVLPGLMDAVDFIAQLRQTPPERMPVGRRVVVVGGGMTAVDAAVQAKLLGAEEVSMVYRRGPQDLSASQHEQDWAQTHGVRIMHWAAPIEILQTQGQLSGVRFAYTQLVQGRLQTTAQRFELPADMVLKAIGQRFITDPLLKASNAKLEATPTVALRLRDGRIDADEQGRTSHPKVWAGGDCRAEGLDLTVQAVADGKRAAESIHQTLMQG